MKIVNWKLKIKADSDFSSHSLIRVHSFSIRVNSRILNNRPCFQKSHHQNHQKQKNKMSIIVGG